MNKIILTATALLLVSGASYATQMCQCANGDIKCINACTKTKVKNAKAQVATQKQADKAFLKADKAVTKEASKDLKGYYK
ncbi:MAG: hypothetical protein J6V56_08015, partial [Clostridia bacterium]|nr:hypothetical protein [Clostridia bacterium]